MEGQFREQVMVVGLGNPGREYEHTRHNAGYMAVDELARRWDIRFTVGRCSALVARGSIDDNPVVLAKPTTYMNRSGESVGCLARWYSIPVSQIIVIVDDADLPSGALRLRHGGSSGGHRGLQSIETNLGTRDYARVRIGIGRSGLGDLRNHVLERCKPGELRSILDTVSIAADAVEAALGRGFEVAMNQYNTRRNGESTLAEDIDR